jgi:methyltransferase (TIGR00027 family)
MERRAGALNRLSVSCGCVPAGTRRSRGVLTTHAGYRYFIVRYAVGVPRSVVFSAAERSASPPCIYVMAERDIMEPGQPSRTAHRVAMARAAHQILDHPRVFDDPIALPILGAKAASGIADEADSYRSTFATSLRAFLVARSKYAEDLLRQAVQHGVRQYVILGAGLDTFSYRNPYPSDVLQVFEVDYPSTQQWKREQLHAASIAIPPSVTFAAIDFETQTLADQLRKAGFKAEQPAFFSWLGVTMYLEERDVLATLSSIASFAAAGSGVVFDYSLSPSLMSSRQLASYNAGAARVAAVGEPWKSSFDPAVLAATVTTLGFKVLEDLGPETINERFFGDRDDGLCVSGRGHLISLAL